MTPAFNLLDEPWIPVRTHAGEVFDVNLSDALLKARDYAALAETSPPNLIALYRLLLAMLHRALTTHHGKWSDKDRARWFREGLPEEPIRAYLTEWRERFWLFHPTEPFMQVAALAEENETKDAVFHSASVSINRFFGPEMFDHSVFDTGPQPTGLVVRDMLGYFQFAPGGFFPGKKLKSSDKAGALVSTAAVLPMGSNLAETLLFGLHPFNRADDLPSWERPAPTVALLRADPTLATGPNDRYTRQTRSILFSVDRQPSEVQFLRMAAGVALQEDMNAPDAMAGYRISKQGNAVRIAFSEGRAIWRELPSLVPDPGRAHDIPPAIVGWAANLLDALDEADANLQVLTAGMTFESGKAKPLRWRAERIEMPGAMLMQPDAAAFLRMQVRFAEGVHAGLRNVFTDLIVQTMPDPKHNDTRVRAKKILTNGSAASVFFSTAERALPKLMRQIAEGEIEAADRNWKTMLIDAANRAWTATRQSLGDSPAVLRAEARTWPRFRSVLKTLIPLAAQAASTTEEVAA
jgi:CRISPR system Cascade subunit CasA